MDEEVKKENEKNLIFGWINFLISFLIFGFFKINLEFLDFFKLFFFVLNIITMAQTLPEPAHFVGPPGGLLDVGVVLQQVALLPLEKVVHVFLQMKTQFLGKL